jgi:hypothetical protein
MIETDITRELMGHERDDADNYYKDKIILDLALLKLLVL